MPRGNVSSHVRRRHPRACNDCRSSKRRCDGARPCSVCVRRGIGRSCTYPLPLSASSPSARPSTLPATPSPPPPPPQPSQPSQPRQAPSPQLRGRMLLDARGETVSVGNVSVQAFVDFLRRSLRVQLGQPSLFTTDRPRDAAAAAGDEDAGLHPLAISEHEAQTLLDSFLDSTNGLYDLYSTEEVDKLFRLRAQGALPTDSLDLAAINAILAIGAQARMLELGDSAIAAVGLSYARRVAFLHRLENPCVQLVRVFLLLSSYMITAGRRHLATVYIGVAASSAIVLGLHVSEQHSLLAAEERAKRWRTFRSLYIVDSLHASLLGRPCIAPAWTKDLTDPGPETRGDKHNHATMELCLLVHQIMCHVQLVGHAEATVSQNTTKELIAWAKGWTEEYAKQRAEEALASILPSRRSLVSALHVSCIYYHAIMLTTRSALVESLTARSRETEGASDLVDEATPKWMSEACTDAAIHVAHACHDAFSKEILFNDMILVRTVLFEAGLLLGFVFHLSLDGMSQVEHAFWCARQVLAAFSTVSILAKEHSETLDQLHEAITIIRRQRAQRKADTFNPHKVERLLTFETALPPVMTAAALVDFNSSGHATTLQSQGEDSSFELDFAFDWSQSAAHVSHFLPLASTDMQL